MVNDMDIDAQIIEYINYVEIERGLRDPKITTLEKIAKGLEISLSKLFDF